MATFRVLSLPEKNSTTIFFFDEISTFLKVLDSESRFWKRCSGFCCQTVTYNEWNWPKHLIYIQIFTFWEIFSGFRKWQNSISGNDKTEILIYKVSFPLHSLVELIQNSTNAKEQQIWSSQCLQKRASKLVSLLEHKKSRGFSVFAQVYSDITRPLILSENTGT